MRPIARSAALLLLPLALGLASQAGAAGMERDFRRMIHLTQMSAYTGQGATPDMVRQIRRAVMDLRRADHGDSVYYANGQTATSWAHKPGSTLYYPNGQTATSWSQQDGATWYYPNGETATSWVNQVDATWYYPNGQTITSWAGKVGATWYHPNGQTATSWAGQGGASWYDADGNTLYSDGPELSVAELLDVPRVVLEYLWFERAELVMP